VNLVFRQQISAIEGRARNDLERWKLECTNDIRKDSVNRSRSTLKGRISEQMAPLLPEFPPPGRYQVQILFFIPSFIGGEFPLQIAECTIERRFPLIEHLYTFL
jgi:hypothetical protein